MKSKKQIRIGSHFVGEGAPVYIVAELSANHLQDRGRALEILHAAHEAGADAFKLQTYRADTITLDSARPEFLIGGGTPWDGERLYQLYEKAYTPWEWHQELMEEAEKLGMDCFSSPFDPTAVELMGQLKMPAVKIASYEIADIPLIKKAAALGVPMILSTGIAHLSDIEAAIRACGEMGNDRIILLKCVSEYPTPYSEVHLNMLPTLERTFRVITGLSDHTLGYHIPVAACALGAKLVEKHLTLKRSDGGPDGDFSMEPAEFAEMVKHIRETEAAMGDADYHLTPAQEAERSGGRSLYVTADLKPGDVFTEKNIKSVRPAEGLPPVYLEKVLGKQAACGIAAGTPLKLELVKF